MASDCECILTYIDDRFKPSNFSFDFDKSLISGGDITIDFSTYMNESFRIVGLEERSDLKCVELVVDPGNIDHGVVYTFNTVSKYWDYNFRADSFEIRFKDMLTGEIAVVSVTIRSVENSQFEIGPGPSTEPATDITVVVEYPYPSILRINMNYAWSDPEVTPDYVLYKTGNADPDFIQSVSLNENDPHEMIVTLQVLADQNTTTRIPFYFANTTQLPVDEQTDLIAFAEVILDFNT